MKTKPLMDPDPGSPRVFSTAEVAKLSGISPSTVRRWVSHGLLHPGRGPRGHRFSWADVSRVRRWSSLSSMPVTRVARALSRHHDPGEVRIRARGRTLALADSQGVFEADTGQSLLPFDEPAGSLCAMVSAGDWRVSLDAARSRGDIEQAQVIVEAHLRVHPADSGAWFESAALHHLTGELDCAVRAYERSVQGSRGAQRARGLFNLGVVHEDAGRDEQASRAYADALVLVPDFADAHYNAARVWERLGGRWRALQHLHAYRRLRR